MTFAFVVFDINRVAAVIQAVVQHNSTIYGMYYLFLLVLIVHDYLIAASDSRKNGIAAGY